MFTLHAALQADLNANVQLTATLLLSLGRFEDTTLRRTTYHHDLTWDTHTWRADGLVTRVDQIPMPGDWRQAATWTFELSGLDPQSQEPFERQLATVYLAFIENGLVVGDALALSKGVMHLEPFRETQGTAVQPVTVEFFWNLGTRLRQHNRTDDAQRDRYSGDRAFRDLAKARESFTGGAGVNIFR